MKKTILIAAILVTTNILAEDITTLNGTKYENVTVTRIDPNGISISHSDGLAKIAFADLSEELRTKYGYDPKKAAQFTKEEQAAAAQRASMAVAIAQQQAAARGAAIKQQAKEQAEEKRIASESEEFEIKVRDVIQGGAIVCPSIGRVGTRVWVLFGGNTNMSIALKGLTGVAEGEFLGVQAYRDGTVSIGGRTLQKWVFVKRVEDPKGY